MARRLWLPVWCSGGGSHQPNTEIIITANDLEQSVSRVFKTVAALIDYNPALSREAEAFRLLPDAQRHAHLAYSQRLQGRRGKPPQPVVYDEIWGFESEKARRLYEELTPPPTEFSA